MTATTVSRSTAETVLDLVAEWLGQHGCGTPVCPDGRDLNWVVSHTDDGTSCLDFTVGPAPTGEEAANRGLGPVLRMDWDWPGSPTPSVILEGGPYDWAVECSFDIQRSLDERGIAAYVEPYSGWALCIYPL